MSNTLLNNNQGSTVLPKWDHPIIPGHAVQGSLLFTLSDFVDPPQQSNLFRWIPMEDIIGTQDVRLDFNEEENKFTIMKAKGHMDNNGDWHQDWFEVGSFNAISKEVQEALEAMKYVQYIFDTSTANTLKVIGVLKDGVQELLCLISFVSKQEFDNAVTNIYSRINQEVTRATNRENEIETALGNEVTRATNRENQIEASVVTERNRAIAEETRIEAKVDDETERAVARENELEDMIEDTTPKAGAATEVVDDATGGKAIDVLVDNDNVKIDNSNRLTTDVFDDTQVRSDKGWSSARISQELVGAMHYMGQVPTYADLPTTGMRAGDLYNVADTGDNYAWDATNNRWDKQAGDYIPGPGIDITGKRISATGVSFGTGDGLEVIGSGADATLRVKGGDGLQFAADKTVSVKPGDNVTVGSSGVSVKISDGLQPSNNGIKVKPANGINVSAEGVSVKVGRAVTIDTNGNVEVRPEETSPLIVNVSGLDIQTANGIYVDDNKLKIKTNFNISSEALGNKESRLTLHSDGKISVDQEKVVFPYMNIKKSKLLELVDRCWGSATTKSWSEWNLIFWLFKEDFTVINEILAADFNKYSFVLISSGSAQIEANSVNKPAGVMAEFRARVITEIANYRGATYPANSAFRPQVAWNAIVPMINTDAIAPDAPGQGTQVMTLTITQLIMSQTVVTPTLSKQQFINSLPEDITIYAYPLGA